MREPSLLAAAVVDVERPVDEVFAYATNLENFGEWFPGVVAIRSDNDAPHGTVGKRYLETVKVGLGRVSHILIEVKESQPGARFVTEGRASLLPRMQIDFSATPSGGTRVAWRMVSRNPSRWFRWLLLPVVRAVMRGRAPRGLRRLKSRLESSGGQAEQHRSARGSS